MELKDQVVSLELAKKLKELGFKQESMFYWYELFEGETSVGVSSKANVDVPEGEEQIIFVETSRGFHSVNEDLVEEPISAYTVAELGEMLKELDHPVPYWCSQALVKSWCGFRNGEAYEICEANEANARAKMLIYLAENKLLTLLPMNEKRQEEPKTEQCFCKSYYDDDGMLMDCTCGKCHKKEDEFAPRCEECITWWRNRPKCFMCGKPNARGTDF